MRVYAVSAQIKRPARSRSYLYYYIIYYGSDDGDGRRSKKKIKINRLGVGATALVKFYMISIYFLLILYNIYCLSIILLFI